MIDDCIYHQIVDTDSSVQVYQHCVTRIEVSKISTLLHNDPAAGYLGIAKTLQPFHWPSIKGDVEVLVSSCDQC